MLELQEKNEKKIRPQITEEEMQDFRDHQEYNSKVNSNDLRANILSDIFGYVQKDVITLECAGDLMCLVYSNKPNKADLVAAIFEKHGVL